MAHRTAFDVAISTVLPCWPRTSERITLRAGCAGQSGQAMMLVHITRPRYDGRSCECWQL